MIRILTVDIKDQSVLYRLQRHGWVEGLTSQRLAVVSNAGPELEQGHLSLLQQGGVSVGII